MKIKLKKLCVLTVLTLALLIAALPMLFACDEADDGISPGGTDSLVIYNWEDYLDMGDPEMDRQSLRTDFARYYKNVTGRDINIVYTTYDTNETMMTKVLKGDANVDLICPSEYSIEKLLLAGCLEDYNKIYADVQPQLQALSARLDSLNSANLSEQQRTDINDFSPTFAGISSLDGNGNGNIEPAVMDTIKQIFSAIDGVPGVQGAADMTDYMVPYMYGTLGILYNKSVVSEQELEQYGWGVLWNVQQNKRLENKILMKDSVRDTYAAALFYMYEYNLLPQKYYDNISGAQDLINLTDDEIMDLAEDVLTKQRDHIAGYEVDFGKDDMLNEIVYADFAWSGDAMWAVDESYDEQLDDYTLGYYCPSGVNPTTSKQRFSNIWYDGWVIPKTVKNKLAALMFVDYMSLPKNAIRNSIYIGYTCAVSSDMLKAEPYVGDMLEAYEYDFDEFFDDEGRFPTISPALGVMRDFGNKNEALVNMWQRAKTGGFQVALVIILAVVIALIAIYIAVYAIRQALKARPRKLAFSTGGSMAEPDDKAHSQNNEEGNIAQNGELLSNVAEDDKAVNYNDDDKA